MKTLLFFISILIAIIAVTFLSAEPAQACGEFCWTYYDYCPDYSQYNSYKYCDSDESCYSNWYSSWCPSTGSYEWWLSGWCAYDPACVCTPYCPENCGQADGCGGYCSTADLYVCGECGNPSCTSCQYCYYGSCYNYCSGTDTNCGCTSCTNCNNYDGCIGVNYYNYYCSGTSCTYSISYNDSRCCKAQGESCTAGSQCCSGYCVDGVCCNTSCIGTCRTCYLSATYKGTCYYHYSETDPDNECYGTGTCGGICNGSGSCQYPSTSVTCSSLLDCDYLNYYYQSPGGDSPTGTDKCYHRNYVDTYRYCSGTGYCASLNCSSYSNIYQYECGYCKYIPSNYCTGSTKGSCTNYAYGTSCGTNMICDGSGNCVSSLKENGEVCTANSQCQSGYCVDGVCCNNSCTGTCRHCNHSGQLGTCTYITTGQDPDSECYGTGTCGGTCNGSGSCQYPSTSVSCGTKDCDYLDTTCRNYHDVTRYCNGAGSCGDPTCNSYTNASYGTDCGTCKTCNGSGSCSSTPADDSACGTIDCDGLDTYYQSGTESPTATEYCYYKNYSDLTSNRCEGFGNCKDANTADCTIYSDTLQYSCGTCKYISATNCTGGTQGSCTNYSKGTSCGTTKECDGSGNCVNCAPPTGTISASKTSVQTGEQFTITVTGNDDNDVWYLYVKEGAGGTWDSQACLFTQTSCTKTWNFTKTTAGTYQYYGRVIDSDDVHGCSSYHESATTPTYVTVTVTQACKSNGQTCSAGSECCSTYCKDGVCCNSSCTGTCVSCNLAGGVGTCSYVPNNQDPDNECYGTGTCGGTCNGSGSCQYPAAGTKCGTCQTCNGSGSCNQTPADDPDCGTIDCDGLDNYYQSGTESPTATEDCYYRNYSDLTSNRCEGFGNCKDANTADCTIYSDILQYSCGTCKYISATNCTGGTKGSCTNYALGTSCGTNKECNGSGICVTCYYPTGSISASKATVNTGETFTISITGHDDHDVYYITYNKGSNTWNDGNKQQCLLQQYDCTKSWDITESTGGTYTYYGWVQDSDNSGGHGCASDHKASIGSVTVTVTQINPPTARTDPATDVEETTATLKGAVTDTGGADYRVRFNYGDTSSYGSNSDWTDYYSYTTSFTWDKTGLTRGKTYHFRIQAENSAGSGYGSDRTFITKPDPPSSFTVTATGANQIDLSWSKGSGAYYTMIRRKTGSYPTSPSDGTQAYYGTGTSKSDTGLTAGTTYYYRAWSRAYEETLYQYSDSYASGWATTFSGVCSSLSYPTDKWQRVWYEYDPGSGTLTNCIGDDPETDSNWWTNETFDKDWGSGVVGGYKEDEIGFKSSRRIYFGLSGFYEIAVGSNDGFKLWVDTDGNGSLELVMDFWYDKSFYPFCYNKAVEIEGVGYHKFRLDYYDNTGGARVAFVRVDQQCKEECGSRGYSAWGSGCEYIEDFYIPTGGTCACPYEEIGTYGCSSETCYCYPYIYNLSANPGSGSVSQGDSISTTVNVATSCNTSGGDVEQDYSASGLPSGTSASFNPTKCNLCPFPCCLIACIEPSCSSEMTISTASYTPTGTYSIIVDGTAHRKTTKPTTYSLIVTEPKPDLVITNGWDDNGIVEYTIKNQGEGDAGESYTALYIKDTTDTWVYRANDYEGPLSAGGSRGYGSSQQSFPTYTLSDRATDCADRAEMPVSVCADYYSPRVAESNEGNNCFEFPVTCDTTPPTATITTNPLPKIVGTNRWFKDSFTANFEFRDSGGSGLAICQYRVICGTADTDWVSVSCSGDGPVSVNKYIEVGSGKWCSRERYDACKISVHVEDGAGNSPTNPEEIYGIDYEAPTTE